MTSFVHLPDELLTMIFVQDLLQSSHRPDQCNFVEYDTKQENYLAYLVSRKISIKLYAAARKAFWTVYTAKCSFHHAMRVRQWDQPCGGLLASAEMLRECQNLEVSIGFGRWEASNRLLSNVSEKLISFLKEGSSISNIDVEIRYEDSTVPGDACWDALGMVKNSAKTSGRKLNTRVIFFNKD